MKSQTRKIFFISILLLLSAISPNLFVVAQAGVKELSTMAIQFLIPSIALIIILILLLDHLQYKVISRLAVNGILAGILSTFALEIIRETGFRLGTMPGDMPRLMGVLLLNQFASGPDFWSDLAGWAYHFWNGASFGIIFSLLMGQSKPWNGILFGVLIGLGFMVSPVVKSLGIGVFGLEFKRGFEFLVTVTLAHMAFGITLSLILSSMNKGIPPIWYRFRTNIESSPKYF